MNIELEPGEHEILHEGASHLFNFIAVGGTVTLTNKRILFTTKSATYNHQVSIPLADISRLDYFKTMLINPNGLSLMLKNGNIEHFVFDDRVSWYKKIESLIKLPA